MEAAGFAQLTLEGGRHPSISIHEGYKKKIARHSGRLKSSTRTRPATSSRRSFSTWRPTRFRTPALRFWSLSLPATSSTATRHLPASDRELHSAGRFDLRRRLTIWHATHTFKSDATTPTPTELLHTWPLRSPLFRRNGCRRRMEEQRRRMLRATPKIFHIHAP